MFFSWLQGKAFMCRLFDQNLVGLSFDADDMYAWVEPRAFFPADALRFESSLDRENIVGNAAWYAADIDLAAPDVKLSL